MSDSTGRDRLSSLAADVSEFEERQDAFDKRQDKFEERLTQLEDAPPVEPGADPDELANLSGEVHDLRNTLVKTVDKVERIAKAAAEEAAAEEAPPESGSGSGSAAEGIGGPESWLDVHEGRAPEYMAEVWDFVTRTAPYLSPGLSLTPCWRLHHNVIQLLHDARWMWQWTYRTDKPRPSDLLAWHTSYWQGLAKLVNAELNKCWSKDGHTVGGEVVAPFPTEWRKSWNIADERPEQYEHAAQVWAGRSPGRPAGAPTPAEAEEMVEETVEEEQAGAAEETAAEGEDAATSE